MHVMEITCVHFVLCSMASIKGNDKKNWKQFRDWRSSRSEDGNLKKNNNKRTQRPD